MALQNYIDAFQDVRPNRSGGRASPHKVCLLYAAMDLAAEGKLGLNAVYLNDALKNRFTWHFERLKGPGDQLNISNPFFYLKSSSFWHHQVRPAQQANYDAISTPSEKRLLETVEYAYLDEELFRLLHDPLAAMQLRIALETNIDSRELAFTQWARSIGKSEKSVKNYVGALKGSISNWFADAKIIDVNILSISDYFEISRLMDKALQVEDFVSGNGMYSAALKLYHAYLDELTQAEANQDIAVIESDSSLVETTKTALVQARRGQGGFREKLIRQWGGCAVTGYANVSLLLASHIKPWASSEHEERLDPYNGLLLVPNLDKAFDLHFVSFSKQGKILIAEQLGDYQSLGIHPEMQVPLSEQHLPYLDHHRERYFDKNA